MAAVVLLSFTSGYRIGYRVCQENTQVTKQIIPYTKVIRIGDTQSKDTEVSVDTEPKDTQLVDTQLSEVDTEVGEDTKLVCTDYFINIHISTELGLAHTYSKTATLPLGTELKIDTLVSGIETHNCGL